MGQAPKKWARISGSEIQWHKWKKADWLEASNWYFKSGWQQLPCSTLSVSHSVSGAGPEMDLPELLLCSSCRWQACQDVGPALVSPKMDPEQYLPGSDCEPRWCWGRERTASLQTGWCFPWALPCSPLTPGSDMPWSQCFCCGRGQAPAPGPPHECWWKLFEQGGCIHWWWGALRINCKSFEESLPSVFGHLLISLIDLLPVLGDFKDPSTPYSLSLSSLDFTDLILPLLAVSSRAWKAKGWLGVFKCRRTFQVPAPDVSECSFQWERPHQGAWKFLSFWFLCMLE